MEKKIYEYSKRKEVHLYGETNVTEGERKFGNALIFISFFLVIITWILVFSGILNFFMIFAPFIPSVLFLLYLTVKYVFLKKMPMHCESYDIKVNGNDTEISNYKEKIINGNEEQLNNEYDRCSSYEEPMQQEQNNKNGIFRGLLFGFGMIFIISIGVYICTSITSKKLVCKSSEAEITLKYSNNQLIGFTANNVKLDINQVKETIKEIGMEEYLKQFELWFKSNTTNGICEYK